MMNYLCMHGRIQPAVSKGRISNRTLAEFLKIFFIITHNPQHTGVLNLCPFNEAYSAPPHVIGLCKLRKTKLDDIFFLFFRLLV